MATKGIEYLLVIGYLLLFVPVWRVFFATERRPERVRVRPIASAVAAMRPWFRVPDGVSFHPGHAWAIAEGDDVFRVGLDDFAQRLLGPPKSLQLPEVGSVVEQGEPGWRVQVDGHAVPVLSPLRGEVLETNPLALAKPGTVCDDPYGKGWLMRVRAPNGKAAQKGLLSGNLARAWMDDAAARLDGMMGASLGPVLQDGGIPVSGFARELDPDGWDRIAAELLLTA